MEIRSAIREILTKNDFVSLPGVGSFIQKYEPARLSPDGTTFLPPRQTVTFDTSRVFNDEAIENYICSVTGVNHVKASEILTEFINQINTELKQGKEIQFQNIGSLSKDINGVIHFNQAPESELASSTFGLSEVKSGKKEEKKPVIVEKKIIYQSKTYQPKHTIRVKPILITSSLIVAAALIVALIMIPDLRFWVTNPEVISQQDSEKEKVAINQVNEPAAASEEQNSINTETIPIVDDVVNQEIETQSDKKNALYYEEPKQQDNKTYYIIAGSFGKLENAQKLANQANQKGFQPEILQAENMYRVSILKFTDRNRALAELGKLRREKPDESFWLLGL